MQLNHLKRLILGSQSPRRQELLHQLGIPFEIVVPDVDESVKPGETPKVYATRIATEKAQSFSANDTPIITADTIVVIDDQILQKPVDETDAIRMLQLLSGRTHQVFSVVCVRVGEQYQTALNISDVTFRKISAQEAKDYWQTGEPSDKAGAYAIQGIGAIFIEKISGSYSGIMGLPLFETSQLLSVVFDPVN